MRNFNIYGPRYSSEGTLFRLWAPKSRSVMLRLFSTGSEAEGSIQLGTPEMDPAPGGVFSCYVPGDLHGVYYDFILRDEDGHETRSADPWAAACGVDGDRSMVVDLRRTDPEGWEADRPVESDDVPVIWETHIQDFSHNLHGGFPEKYRGKYKAFTCPDTCLDNDPGIPTGIPYLQKLGITHVQLQPISDFATVDERDALGYNWGYDVKNYNIPEGYYSTDPFHGEVRIRECKEMIQAIHRAGIGVVLDVVYNHTYYNNSYLQRTAPGEYYRFSDSGEFMNASGCGNETASEREPFRNYMISSMLYWASEYHVDGFRLDLMGIHDTKTISLLRQALDELPGRDGKRILLYGEPWTCFAPALKEPDEPVTWKTMRLLSPRIGAFADTTRSLLVGTPFNSAATGYGSDWLSLQDMNTLKGAVCGYANPNYLRMSSSPLQAYHYVSCHDNYTLMDRLSVWNHSYRFEDPDKQIVQRIRFISGIYMTCTGAAFMLSGEEFCRTKHGEGNTYLGPASLNQLNWENVRNHADLVEWYRGLIALRRLLFPSASALENDGGTLTGNILFLDPPSPEVLLYVRPASPGTGYSRFIICYNPLWRDVNIPLPGGNWEILCDGQTVSPEGSGVSAQTNYTVSSVSLAVLAQASATSREAVPEDSRDAAGESSNEPADESRKKRFWPFNRKQQ